MGITQMSVDTACDTKSKRAPVFADIDPNSVERQPGDKRPCNDKHVVTPALVEWTEEIIDDCWSLMRDTAPLALQSSNVWIRYPPLSHNGTTKSDTMKALVNALFYIVFHEYFYKNKCECYKKFRGDFNAVGGPRKAVIRWYNIVLGAISHDSLQLQRMSTEDAEQLRGWPLGIVV